MSTRQQRLRPLQTFGNSFVATAQRAYARAQKLDGPSGSLFKGLARVRLAFIASLFIRIAQHLVLAGIYLADIQILVAESVMEKVFPPSSHAFDKIDQLLQLIEHLPDKTDAMVDSVPHLIRKIPFLEWILGVVVSGINFWIYKFAPVELGIVREKDVVVDASYSKESLKSECADEAEDPIIDSPKEEILDHDEGESSAVPDTQKPENKNDDGAMSLGTEAGIKGTCKEALEKGMKEPKEASVKKRKNPKKGKKKRPNM